MLGGQKRSSGEAELEVPHADVTPTIRPADVHVLLVDDEKISRLVIAKLLRRCGSR